MESSPPRRIQYDRLLYGPGWQGWAYNQVIRNGTVVKTRAALEDLSEGSALISKMVIA